MALAKSLVRKRTLRPSTAEQDEEIDLKSTHKELVKVSNAILKATAKHNEFLKELGLPPLP